eukprot:Phypoly_transcript_08547.p1 GENE.Phypoly_transcript_08547~~Phypoly_transcript_08547.p1  ORF type:complete len:446 (+),score=64.23 Phypoly_transcript_08547:139-1476(+)
MWNSLSHMMLLEATMLLWWVVVVTFLVVGCATSSSDLCVFYATHEEIIDATVLPCAQQTQAFDRFVSLQSDLYKYYLVNNYNNTKFTKEFVSGIATHADSFVYSTTLSALVSVKTEKEDAFMRDLPMGAELISISPRPQIQIDAAKLETLRILAHKANVPNPIIQGLVDQVNEENLRYFVEFLSGELPGSPLYTRNSLSKDAVVASEWLTRQFTSFGFQTSIQCYRADYSCNVVATRKGSTLPNEVIIVGAHYDSRASSATDPTQRAPGANDDGSGTGTLLQIAKAISSSDVKFSRTIRLVVFSGEEQGLYGSQAYAEAMVKNKTNVIAMIQNDMIAYRAEGTGLLCGFPLRYTTPELTELAIATSNLYSPTLSTGRNERCCSDHRSFYERGFPATDFSDTLGPIVDPEYHSAGDIVNRVGFDFTKYAAIVKGIFATAAVIAEPL